jgi:hypothetical protein
VETDTTTTMVQLPPSARLTPGDSPHDPSSGRAKVG